MRCQRVHKLLSAYLDGELEVKDQKALESHLNRCESCANAFHALQTTQQLLIRAERFTAPPGFCLRLMAKLDPAPPLRFSLLPLFVRFAETMVLLLVIGIGVIFSHFLVPSTGVPGPGDGAALLSLDLFDPAPSGSLSEAYLAMMEKI
jgi:anti-sigma factor RsiW